LGIGDRELGVGTVHQFPIYQFTNLPVPNLPVPSSQFPVPNHQPAASQQKRPNEGGHPGRGVGVELKNLPFQASRCGSDAGSSTATARAQAAALRAAAGFGWDVQDEGVLISQSKAFCQPQAEEVQSERNNLPGTSNLRPIRQSREAFYAALLEGPAQPDRFSAPQEKQQTHRYGCRWQIVEMNRLALPCFVQNPLDLKFFLPDAMRFVPVNFSRANCIIWQTYRGNPFHFSPSACTIHFLKPANNPNGIANGYRLHIREVTQNLKLHGEYIFPLQQVPKL